MIPPPGKKPLHTRAYDINSYVEDDDHFRLTGVLRDQRPDGLWGIEDTEPLLMHHMQIELVIHARTLAITEVETRMLAHPQTECPLILPVFQQLVGLNIARGFTHKVRELFGGPRACTHFVALLNAMAPVAMQTLWAFFSQAAESGPPVTEEERLASRRAGLERNRDTCHVWASDGPMFAAMARGDAPTTMLSIKKRLEERGIPLEEWEANVGMR